MTRGKEVASSQQSRERQRLSWGEATTIVNEKGGDASIVDHLRVKRDGASGERDEYRPSEI